MSTLHTPLAHRLTEAEREAVRDWLAGSSKRPQAAKDQWRKGGIAALALGRRFSAVRLTEPLVHAVTTSALSATVTRVLASTLNGPVIHDPQGRRFYALTPRPSQPGRSARTPSTSAATPTSACRPSNSSTPTTDWTATGPSP